MANLSIILTVRKDYDFMYSGNMIVYPEDKIEAKKSFDFIFSGFSSPEETNLVFKHEGTDEEYLRIDKGQYNREKMFVIAPQQRVILMSFLNVISDAISSIVPIYSLALDSEDENVSDTFSYFDYTPYRIIQFEKEECKKIFEISLPQIKNNQLLDFFKI